MSVLAIWMNGVYVGEWQRVGRLPAVLRYDDAWVKSTAGRPLFEALAQRMRAVQANGYTIWCIFDNTAQGHAVPNALRLMHSLAEQQPEGS